MKTIIITGPSGSGKTLLSNKLANLFKESIIIKTDSYYKDDFIIKLLSIFIHDVYDRIISIRKKEIIKTINSIYNKNNAITLYKYNFKNKKSSKIRKEIKNINSTRYLILEGIFAHRLTLDYKKTINIVCEEKKELCYERRLIRDKKERGRNRNEVNNKFSKSWILYYKYLKRFIQNNKIIVLNTVDLISYNELINRLK